MNQLQQHSYNKATSALIFVVYADVVDFFLSLIDAVGVFNFCNFLQSTAKCSQSHKLIILSAVFFVCWCFENSCSYCEINPILFMYTAPPPTIRHLKYT